MANTKPISNLRNYTDILGEIKEDKPIVLTSNGHGEFVILKLSEYERLKASIKLLAQLNIGEKSAREKSWISKEEAITKLGL